MDWSNERYVRFYTRDTTTWRLLCWQAQAVFPQLLKHVDRAGVFDLGGVSPAEGVAAALPKWPLEVIEAAIGSQDDKESLVGRGVIELGDDAIVLPKFIEAQEAAQSDAQRKRDERSRRRAKARHGRTAGHETGPPVTNRDDESQTVTDGHDRSLLPSRAEPSQAEAPKAPTAASASIPSTPSRGEPAPAAALRNPPVDERDLDDPDVRSTGDVVSTGALTTHELELQRGAFVASLGDEERLRVPAFTRGGKTADGLLVALRSYGADIVLRVVRWSWAEAAAGRLEARLLACTFHGSGFDARLEAWRKAEEHERRRARLGVQREAEAAPLPDHNEFFGLADQLENVTARLRGEA